MVKIFLILLTFLSCKNKSHTSDVSEGKASESVPLNHSELQSEPNHQKNNDPTLWCQKIQNTIKKMDPSSSLETKQNPSQEHSLSLVQYLQSADCALWGEFAQSEQFHDMMSKKNTSTVNEQKVQTAPQHLSLAEEQSSLSDDQMMEKVLFTMALIGFAGAAKLHFMNHEPKKAFFVILLSTTSAYFSYKLSNQTISDTDRDMIPFVFFFSGLLSLTGAAAMLSGGFDHWTKNFDDSTQMPEPKTFFEKLKTLGSMNDQGFRYISEKAKRTGIDIQPQTLKKIAGAGGLASGGVLGFIAIQKFWKSGKEGGKRLDLAEDPDHPSFEILERDLRLWLTSKP